MQVADILQRKGSAVLSIHEDAPLNAAVAIMDAQDAGALVVLDRKEHVVGLITERDIIHTLARHRNALHDLHVHDVMNRHVCICGPRDRLKQAASWMIRHRTRHLPVMDNGKLVGMVNMSDVIERRFDEVEVEANVLREIILATH